MRYLFTPPRPLAALLALLFFAVPPGTALAAEPAPLSLESAIETALSNRPELKYFEQDIEAASAHAAEAALLPNPELILETTNYAEENTIGLSQTYESAAKRTARANARRAEAPLLENEKEAARLSVVEEVSAAYATLLGAGEKLALMEESKGLAAELARIATERVAAGAVSPIEETRAKVFLTGAESDLMRARREYEEASLALWEAMAVENRGPAKVSGRIPEMPVMPDRETVLAVAGGSPELRKWKLEKERLTAVLESERAAASADFTFTGKFTQNRENGDSSATFEVSFPLPFSDVNKGAIREAELGVAKAELMGKAQELKRRAELERRFTALKSLAAEAELVRENMLLPAKKAHEAVSEGYRLGKFRYLDVLDSSAELSGAKLRHLEILISFELEKTALNRLAAKAPTTGKEN